MAAALLRKLVVAVVVIAVAAVLVYAETWAIVRAPDLSAAGEYAQTTDFSLAFDGLIAAFVEGARAMAL